MATPAALQFAWAGPQGNQLVQLASSGSAERQPLPAGLQTPLGSLWKLFVYAWLVDTGSQEPAYACQGQNREEVYCCSAGASITRDQALVRSCGLYFEPQRLKLDPRQWRTYWQARQAPAWLLDLAALQPQARVPVAELLQVLAVLPAQQQARQVLLDVAVTAADSQAVGWLGGRLRVKTWSWLGDQGPQSRQGGFAGWLADGTPVWAEGRGTSQRVLRDYAQALGDFLPALPAQPSGQCVQVALFSRYPLLGVQQPDGKPAAQGALRGEYQVSFANGSRLSVQGDGDLFLLNEGGGLRLVARLDREEYVARVLQREAAAQPAEAARALAVAIRTYLQQNATRQGECLVIDDSSSQQRVAPRPASNEARAVASWTRDLVLAGSAVTYHADVQAVDKLGWQQAVEQAGAGLRYDQILARAYPRASLSRWDNPVASCEPLADAERWLHHQRRSWRQALDQEAGYNEVSQLAVCRLAYGRPHVDRERQRIYVRGLLSLQDRLALTHEYLHLAFEAHPNGQDETYIEGLARHLLLE
jgi:uncharacterized protein YfaQ (DUF2300 family)